MMREWLREPRTQQKLNDVGSSLGAVAMIAKNASIPANLSLDSFCKGAR